ncbi:MAG: shikimate dehydrogenase [Robiginitalea sp.]|nr:shikimate dehydrogenase [Robiginitalea sp.]
MRRFGLIGKDISYSFSPGYFAEKFRKLGLKDCIYEIYDLPEISAFPDLLQQHPDLSGLNVTIPYKEAVIPYLNHLEKQAREIGAVNTLRFTQNGLEGHNTDVTGFRESLRPLLTPADRAALILGTGGASKAVAFGLGQLHIPFRFVSRNPKDGQLSYEELNPELLEQYQVLINCTPLGTFPEVEGAPSLPYEAIGPTHLLYDLIYNPPETTFLKEGKQRGARIKNGLEMLRLQAEASWEIWNS